MSQGLTPDPKCAGTETSPADSESEGLRFTGALPWHSGDQCSQASKALATTYRISR